MQYKSNQQVVEKVAHHLGFQFKKSQKRDRETHRNSCLYRGPNNTMCAAGCLIPDKLYKKELEGVAINAFLNRYSTIYYNKNIDHIFKNIDSDLLRFLQAIHDEYHPNQWRKPRPAIPDYNLAPFPS